MVSVDMWKIIIGNGDATGGNDTGHNTGRRGCYGERITFATFQRSGRAYQQLPPSIPNPGSRKPNSTYQSLSDKLSKNDLKSLSIKEHRCPGIGKQSLNYPAIPQKRGKKRKEGERVGR